MAMVGVGLVMALRVQAAETKTAYQNDFSAAKVDAEPEGMLVYNGAFTVKEEAGNKFLELPGAPLESYGVLFGPNEAAGLSIAARIQGSAKGRRFPTFGVGVAGVGGYKLQVSPAKKLLELFRGEEVVTNAPLAWESGSWTFLRLQSRKTADGQFQVEGKAWKQGEPEPKEWQISRTDKAEVPPGPQSIWGMPYAGTPIRFDDLLVTRVP